MFKPIIIYTFLVSLLAALSGCVSNPKSDASVPVNTDSVVLNYSNKESAVTKLSEEGKYRLSLYSSQFPLQTGVIHNWILHVETPEGVPVENTKIYVHGGMPVHRHGFPTNPRVTRYLGNGDYIVEGIKFSMPGEWEIRFNVKEKNKRDRTIFKVNV
jgi:hypothetical protein